MVRSRIYSCGDETLRLGTPDNESVLSSSWPAAAPLHRQKSQPPRAPLRKPCWASWEVPPLSLGPTTVALEYAEQFSCSGSDDTKMELGEDVEEDELLVFSLEDAELLQDEEEHNENSLYDIQLVGLDEANSLEDPILVPLDNGYMKCPDRNGHACSLDASPGPVLLSALAKVATASWSHRTIRAYSVSGSADNWANNDSLLRPPDTMLSSSWPAATAPPRLNASEEPPKAPSRRPSAAPWEVLPLELPISPRLVLERSQSDDELLGKGCVHYESRNSQGSTQYDDEESDEEEEQLIFAIEEVADQWATTAAFATAAGAEADDNEEESITEAQYLDLRGFTLDEASCSDVDELDNHILEEATGTMASATQKSSQPGASPALLSCLEQVAAEARFSVFGVALHAFQ